MSKKDFPDSRAAGRSVETEFFYFFSRPPADQKYNEKTKSDRAVPLGELTLSCRVLSSFDAEAKAL